MLNSIFGADGYTSEKGRKTKGGKEKGRAAEGKTKGGKEKGQAAEGKTKGGKEKGQAAVFSADQDTLKKQRKNKDGYTSEKGRKTKGGKKKGRATDQDTSKNKGKTRGGTEKVQATRLLEQTLQNLQRMQLCVSTANNNNTTLTAELTMILSDKGYRISDNQGSGNCMFHALSEQLETIKRIKIQHGKIRKSLVQYLTENPKLPDGTDLCHFVDGHETWADYLTYMKQDGAWGDHVILCAAANFFETCIHVVTSLHNDVVIRPHCPVDESKPLILGHINEVHYVSLQPIQEEAPCSSKGKEQPQMNEVLTGPDQDTSKNEEKTKGDKKKDQAAAPDISNKTRKRTQGDKEIVQAAESGGQVVKRTSNRVKWFLSIIIVTTLIISTVVLLLAESGDQEAGPVGLEFTGPGSKVTGHSLHFSCMYLICVCK
ncbi:uncharacterized protein [Pocillopora verrucosa]|uniref:uncharacterized protein n=1 Tax=Pocillopora verrucosa TaxID=203993 RepID=UPI0033407150